MKRRWGRIGSHTRGATTLEYAFIVAFIVIAVIGGIKATGLNTALLWQNSADRVSAVIN